MPPPSSAASSAGPPEPPLVCAVHDGTAAAWRCEGCGRALCEECVEEGHRLVFCRPCGERALPLAEGAPGSAPGIERRRRRQEPVPFQRALGYPLRGQGLYLTLGYTVLLLLYQLGGSSLLVGIAMSLVLLVVSALVPGLLLRIARSTMEGDDELPDWPDVNAWGERASEILALVAVTCLSALPGYLLLSLGGCLTAEVLAGAEWSWSCHLWTVAGVGIGGMLWLGGFASVAICQTSWAAVRPDVHLRVLAATTPDSWRTLFVIVVVYVANAVLGATLGAWPVVGGVLEVGLSVYTLFLVAHLVGLLLRRHHDAVEGVYRAIA